MTTVRDKKGNSLEKYRGKSANLLFDEKAKTVNYYGIHYVKETRKREELTTTLAMAAMSRRQTLSF